MFNTNNWRFENIVAGIAQIPSYCAHFVLLLAILGGVVALTGLMYGAVIMGGALDTVPMPVLFVALGLACFAILFPIPYIIYISKELQRTKERLDRIESHPSNHQRAQPAID